MQLAIKHRYLNCNLFSPLKFGMKVWKTLFILLFPVLISAQESQIFSKSSEAIFKFKKIQNSNSEIGVVGNQDHSAFAVFVDNNLIKDSTAIFNKVTFETLNFNGKKSTVYLCLYENNRGLPGKIIDQAKILVEIPAKRTKITADLSGLKIKVPKNGYFIGFEWILIKENIITGVRDTKDPPYNPTIGGISGEHLNLYVFNKTWQKESKQLVSSLKLELSYLRNN